MLDDMPFVKKGGEIRDTRRLLHIVRNDHDRKFPAQFQKQFLDFERGDRVDGGSRLVEQKNIRFGGDCAGDAETLLLPAGKSQSAAVEFVLDLVPEGGFPGRAFSDPW